MCGMKVPVETELGWAALPLVKDQICLGMGADVFEPRRWIDVE